ncbi:MAG: hypothetical protein ACKOSS_08040, partial [Planctomycetia bacterium]
MHNALSRLAGTLARGARRPLQAACVGVLLALAGCGTETSTFTAGQGGIALSAITPSAFGAVGAGGALGAPAFGGTPITIEGINFETVSGTTARVIFRTVDGSTPFPGPSDTAEVQGLVTGPTTITATAPSVPVCGVAGIPVTVEVILESGVSSGPVALGLTFERPAFASVSPASQACYAPASFTLGGGEHLPPVGTALVVRFSGGPAGSWSGACFADVAAVVASSTTVTGTAPANLSTNDFTANVQALFSDGSCSSVMTAAYRAPSLGGITPSSVTTTVPTAFTLTGGAWLPPVGTTLLVRFSGGLSGSWSGASQEDVPATVASASTITGTTPTNSTVGSFVASVRPIFAGNLGKDTFTLTYGAPTITITQQPVDTSATSAGAASFTVAASVAPSGTPSYQWQKREAGSASWGDIGGATSATLALTGLTNAADNGDSFRVVASATGASPVTSSVATLTVFGITITQQPVDTAASSAGAASLTVAATVSPSGTPGYQWQKRESGAATWANVAGVTSATLALTGLTNAADNGDSYRAVVSASGAPSVTSSVATLTVAGITITLQPTNQSATAAGEASFTAAATVSPSGTPTYQWQKRESGSVTWNDVADATSATLALTGLTNAADDGDGYRVVVSASGAPSVTSSAVTLTVFGISITLQPTSQVASAGGDATFSAAASVSPSGTPGYQWQKREAGGATWANVPGATSATLALTGLVSANDNGDSYRVVVSASGAPSVTSDEVNLTFAVTSTWKKLGPDIDGEAAGDLSGKPVAVTHDGKRLAIGAPGNDDSGAGAGHVRLFDWDGTTWVQRGSDIDGEAAGDGFGSRGALRGNGRTVAIGAPGNDGNGIDAGHVRVYDWDDVLGDWVKRGLDIDGEAAGDQSGWSVALSLDGNTVAI